MWDPIHTIFDLFLIENLWGSHGQEWANDTGPT